MPYFRFLAVAHQFGVERMVTWALEQWNHQNVWFETGGKFYDRRMIVMFEANQTIGIHLGGLTPFFKVVLNPLEKVVITAYPVRTDLV